MKADVKQMTGKVNAIQKVYDSQVAQLADLDAQLAEIQVEQDAKSAQLTQRKTILAGHLRAAYDSDRTSMLETILSADSFSDAIADVGYLIDLGDQDRALAAQIAEDQKTLSRSTQTVSQTRFDTGQLRAADGRPEEGPRLEPDRSQEGEGAAQEARGRRRPPARPPAEGLPGPRRMSAAAAKHILAAEARENAAIDRKIRQLVSRQYGGGGIPSEYSGTLDWPLAGTVTQEFGCTGFAWEPPLGNCAHFHTGIDIADPMGTRDPSRRPGKVIYAGSAVGRRLGGDHRPQPAPADAVRPRRTEHPGPAPGQTVRKGQVIAYVGHHRAHDRPAPPLVGPAQQRSG